MAETKTPVLYNADGTPMVRTDRKTKKSFGGTGVLQSWFRSLSLSNQPASLRSRDPFGNHPWVFAAAMMTSVVASQAPYMIYHEDEETQDFRAKVTRGRGRVWRGGNRGTFRRAIQRHLQIPLQRRLVMRGLEEDYEHPVMNVLLHPNPLQSGIQLWQLTHLWMRLRGECFWVGETADGGNVPPGAIPDRLWCLSPDLFEPILSNGAVGELVGWYFCPPTFMSKRLAGMRLELPLTDVIQFKLPNPVNPLRGLSPIGSIAVNIQLDMLAKDYNRSVLENGGDPGGLILYDSDLNTAEETEFREKWEQAHKGAANARRTAVLSGGFKYQPVAMSPQDLQFLEMMKWDREETLAVMGVPPSILGATQFTNYATALAQDKTFWDKTIISTLRSEEDTLDGTLLYTEPDTVVGAFDLRNVEALRAGTADKISMARDLCEQTLHVPPRTAFDMVGLEVPPYLGDSTVLVAPLNSPLRDVLLPPLPVPEEDDTGLFDAGPEAEETTGDDPVPPPGDDPVMDILATARSFLGASKRLEVLKASRWNQFIKVQQPIENKFRGRYRGWVLSEKRLMLEWFDTNAKHRGLRLMRPVVERIGEDLIATLPDIVPTKNRLKAKVRPLYASTLEQTYQFTLDDVGGITVFEIDDPRILEFFDKRERTFVNATPETVRQNLITSLKQGLADGETVQQLRFRVAQTYDVSASSSKSLQIARTESGSFMNGVRDTMFEAGGFSKEAWSTAQDEHVRDSHVAYGAEDVTDRGFNYLEISGKTNAGILTHPGDVRCADVSEIINCRCLKIPVE